MLKFAQLAIVKMKVVNIQQCYN